MVNRQHRRGLSTHPYGARVLRVSVVQVMLPHHLGSACQEVQDPVAEGSVHSQVPKLTDVLGGAMVLSAEQ
jgi:hypothetical protein